MDLWNELNALMSELSASISKMYENGNAYAEAENAYRIALNQTALRMKAEGISATTINNIIYGDDDVAPKRLMRDTKEVLYEVTKEHIQSLKLQIKIINAQMDREWNNGITQ